MGARGPLPKPVLTVVAQGNPGHKPQRDLQPKRKLPPSLPTPPPDLDGIALEEWNRVLPEIDKLGIVSHVDGPMLAVYCKTWARWCRLDERLSAEGEILKGRDGLAKKNPVWQLWRESAALLQNYAKDLGLSPGARLRLSMPEQEKDGDSEDIFD